MKIGYARAAKGENNLEAQLDELRSAGCDPIFVDDGIGSTASKRPALAEALEMISTFDTLIVWRLDRLGYSLSHLVGLLAELSHYGIEFRSLADHIDTASRSEPSPYPTIVMLAEFERLLIAARTREGLAAARRKGVKVGRKPVLSKTQAEIARDLIAGGQFRKDVAATFGVSQPTLRRALRSHGLEDI